MALPSSAASRIRYRLSKPKPNIDAGKRVQFVGVPITTPLTSAVIGQRGSGINSVSSQPSSNTVIGAVNGTNNDLIQSIDASAERPSSPNLEKANDEAPGNGLLHLTPTKQTASTVSPQKINDSTTSVQTIEIIEDSAPVVTNNLPTPKPRERKISVRGGADGREKDESARHKYKKGPAPPEKSKMTMLDLIYWNPENNPMIQEDADPINESSDSALQLEEAVDDPEFNDESDLDVIKEVNPTEDTGPQLEDDDEDTMPVPQVKIGPDGNIILDEQSLVIQTSAAKKGLSSAAVVHERSSLITTYSSFRKRKLSRTWTDRETSKFYMALSTVGTDFSMMKNLFPKRERHELKLKYKREEKYNKALVDKAIHEPQQYDLSLFEESNSESENQEKVENKKVRRKTWNKKKTNANSNEVAAKEDNKKGGRRQRAKLQEESDTENEEVDILQMKVKSTETGQPLTSNASENVENTETSHTLIEKSVLTVTDEMDNEKDEVILDKVLKRTRSGRQPKKRVPFTVDEETHKRRRKDELSYLENESEQMGELNSVRLENTIDESTAVIILSDAVTRDSALDVEHSYAATEFSDSIILTPIATDNCN